MTATWTAQFSDGQTARSWPARVHLDDRGIIIDRGSGSDQLVWPYGALTTATPLSPGANEAVINYTHMPDAQLFVKDEEFVASLRSHARHLTTAATRWRWARPIIAVAVVIVLIFGFIWVLDLKPARTLAGWLPDSSRQAVGRNVIAAFTAQHKVCTDPDGRAALDKLMARLLSGVAGAERYTITVVDWRLVNAFAAPGGQMIATRGLLATTKAPEEFAGVLAHEIGHGIELHPEAGLIRAVGLSALVELLTGGSSGTLSNLSATILQNSYVRRDERAADQQALRLLQRAGIKQSGLADFFERIGNKPGKKAQSSTLGAFDLLRTHPYPKERADLVRATATYAATPALSAADWRALRGICSKRGT